MFNLCKLQNLRTLRRFINTVTEADLKIVIDNFSRKLKKSNPIEDVDFTIKCLAAHVVNEKFNNIKDVNKVKMTEEQLTTFERLCECRLCRMPIQYIIGEWDFMNLTLKMRPTVFIPRPESEGLVNLALKGRKKTEPFNFLEVGCGSGALSLAILSKLENATAVAIEKSKIACSLTMENAKLLGLDKRITVYQHAIDEKALVPEELNKSEFDGIISNPPYIKTSDIQHLQPEIRVYENMQALDGGADGLSVARNIFALATKHLKKEGKLMLELDPEHPPLVRTLLLMKYKNSLKYISAEKDIHQNLRFIEIVKT